MPKYCSNWVLRITANISCQNNILNYGERGDSNVQQISRWLHKESEARDKAKFFLSNQEYIFFGFETVSKKMRTTADTTEIQVHVIRLDSTLVQSAIKQHTELLSNLRDCFFWLAFKWSSSLMNDREEEEWSSNE